MILCGMLDLCRIIFSIVVDLIRPRAALEAEILVLRQQIIVLRRSRPRRLSFLTVDKVVLGWVYHLFPKACDALAIVRPDTVVRWHRAGFRLFWRWKSRRRLGRPAVPAEIRQIIREMSLANPLWGTPRIHGELLRLGIDVGQTSVAKYMVRRRGPPSQGWKTFLRTNSLMNSAPNLTRRRTPQRPPALALFSRSTGLEGNVSLKRQGPQQGGDEQSI
jgi:hypothetical protein